jgi:ubiquitin
MNTLPLDDLFAKPVEPVEPVEPVKCPDCVKAGGIYSFKCFGCRDRFLMDEPCKIYREIMAKTIQRWGEIGDWKREPSCGCKGQCLRLQAIRNAPLNS